jgi:hypothetical protein
MEEEIRLHLQIAHEESHARVDIILSDEQKKAIMAFISDTQLIFSKRQDGIPVKMWVTGAIHSK